MTDFISDLGVDEPAVTTSDSKTVETSEPKTTAAATVEEKPKNEISAAVPLIGGSDTIDSEEITAMKDKECGVWVKNGGMLTLKNLAIDVSGDSITNDNLINPAYGAFAELRSEIKLDKCTIKTSGESSIGLCSSGTNTYINSTNTEVITNGTNSYGIAAVENGSLNASDVTVITSGEKSDGVFTNNGNISIVNGEYTTEGEDSYGMYLGSNSNIVATKAKITSKQSTGIFINGKGDVSLTGCTVSGAGDSAIKFSQEEKTGMKPGTATFLMVTGEILASEEEIFELSNTAAEITLQGVKISEGKALIDMEESKLSIAAHMQSLTGDIIADDKSELTVYLKSKSVYKGAINTDNTGKEINLNIDGTSKWELTGDSYITSFTDGVAILSNINSNGFSIYYDAEMSGNSWLNGETKDLPGGGKLQPKGFDFEETTTEEVFDQEILNDGEEENLV